MTTDPMNPRRRLRIWIYILTFFIIAMLILIREDNQWNSNHKSPQTAYDFYRQGKNARNSRDFEKAEKSLLKAVELDNQFGKAEVELGAFYFNLYLNEESIKHSNRALELVKDKDKVNEEVAYYNLGVAYRDLNNCQASFDYLRKAYEMKSYLGDSFWSDNPEKYVYYVMKNDKEAYCEKVAQGDANVLPYAVFEWQAHLKRLLEVENYDQIISEGLYFLSKHPGSKYNYVIHKYLVSAYFGKKEYEQMSEHVRQLEAADLKSEDRAWLIYVTAYYQIHIKDYKNALTNLNRVIRDYSHYRDIDGVYFNKVMLLRRMDDVKGEKEACLGIISELPGSSLENFAKGRLYSIALLTGHYDEIYRYMSDQEWNAKMIIAGTLGILLTACLFPGFLFIVMCVFFNQKREEVKKSPFRLRHMFIFNVMDLSFFSLFVWGILRIDHDVAPVFSAISVSPFLSSNLLSDCLVIWYLLYLMTKVYSFDFKTLGWRLLGLTKDIIWPILLVVLLWGIQNGYVWLLEYFNFEVPINLMNSWFRIVLSENNPINLFLLFVGIVIAGPISEEIVYRVFMIQFVKRYTSVWFAVICSSIAFAVSHDSAVLFPLYFIDGLVLAFVYLRTGSIVPCIAMHIINNFLSLIV